MHIILFISIVLIISFLILLFALAKRNPDEKQTEDKEQEEYIRDYAETVRETGGTMKKLEHWKVLQSILLFMILLQLIFLILWHC